MSESSANYEKLVRDVLQALLDETGLTITARCKTDDGKPIRILGKKSGVKHQIDVYWEFKIADVLYRTCIECKNWNKKIEKNYVASFITIMDDIGATGIIATPVGFQKGALQLADTYNLRPVHVIPLIKTIGFNVFVPDFRTEGDIGLELDKNCANSVLKKAGLSSMPPNGNIEEAVICDKNGNNKKTLKEFLEGKDIKPTLGANKITLADHYYYTEIGLIKIKSIMMRTVVARQGPFVKCLTTNKDVARAVIEDVITNHEQYLHDDGSIKEQARIK